MKLNLVKDVKDKTAINLSALSETEIAELRHADQVFTIAPGEFAYSDDEALAKMPGMAIKKTSAMYPGGVVATNDQRWTSESTWLRELGKSAAKAQEADPDAVALPIKTNFDQVEEMLEELPWMMAYIPGDELEQAKTKSNKKFVFTSPKDDCDDEASCVQAEFAFD